MIKMSKATLPNGITIGKAKVVVDIVDGANREIRPRIKIAPNFVTYHNTGNKGRGADARAHNNLIHNLGDKAPRDTSHVSWHFAVDSKFIYQHIPMDELAYHCGDGIGKKSGNMTSVGIEICMHADEPDYHQAEENAIALGIYIAKIWGMPEANHVPHKRWSGKNCPQIILERDKGFDKFHARIKAAIHNKPAIQVQKEQEEPIVKFTSPTLKESFEGRVKSPTTAKLIDNAAVKYLKHTSKLKDGKLSDGDLAAISTELAVYFLKQK